MNWQKQKPPKFADIAPVVASQFGIQLVQACTSKPVRTIMQFACDTVILPNDGGPHGGDKFDPDAQPFVKLFFEELENGQWSEVIVTGPSQSGKTLCAFVIVVLYIAAELRKNVVVGVPIGDMATDKWREDFLPVMKASPELEKLLPKRGPGSQGGRITDSVTLTNGVTIKFMTSGGSDQSKAAFTGPYVIVTEAAGWSEGTAKSKEADPLRQLRARQRSVSRFDKDGNINMDRKMVIEGTVTDEHDLPWRAKSQTTESVIACPCVHCGGHVSPEREHFGGYETAEDEISAAKLGSFFCPLCGESIDDDQRRTMNENAVLLHKGDEIENGEVKRVEQKTTTLWFRWSAFNNMFVRSFDLGLEEWKAAQHEEGTREYEMAEKERCQQVWCVPFAEKMVDHKPLRRTEVRKRRLKLTSGLVPADSLYLTSGIDVGKWYCWYFQIVTYAGGTLLHCPRWGNIETGLDPEKAKSKLHEKLAIINCLMRVFDLLEQPLPMATGGMLEHNLGLVDVNYMPDAVYAALAARAKSHKQFVAAYGRGESVMKSRRYESPPRAGTARVNRRGNGWHREFATDRMQNRYVFDADDSKLSVQASLRVEKGATGALTLPFQSEKELMTPARHLASEVLRQYIDPEKRKLVKEWDQRGENHLLDGAGMALMAQRVCGWELPNIVPPEALPEQQAENMPVWMRKRLDKLNQ